jgi:hypothetical protein
MSRHIKCGTTAAKDRICVLVTKVSLRNFLCVPRRRKSAKRIMAIETAKEDTIVERQHSQVWVSSGPRTGE